MKTSTEKECPSGLDCLNWEVSLNRLREQLHIAVEKALRSHTLSYIQDEDGNAMSLVDRLTPDEDDSVARGLTEIILLTEDIVDAILSPPKSEQPQERHP